MKVRLLPMSFEDASMKNKTVREIQNEFKEQQSECNRNSSGRSCD